MLLCRSRYRVTNAYDLMHISFLYTIQHAFFIIIVVSIGMFGRDRVDRDVLQERSARRVSRSSDLGGGSIKPFIYVPPECPPLKNPMFLSPMPSSVLASALLVGMRVEGEGERAG